MASSVKRFVAWFAVVAAAMTALAAVAAERRVTERQERATEPEYDRRLSLEATRLATSVRVLERRDSLVRALRAAPPRPGLSIVFERRVTPRVRSVADSVTRSVWNAAVGTSAVGPMLVVFADERDFELPARIRPGALSHILLPSQTDGRTCVVVVTWGIDALGAHGSVRNYAIGNFTDLFSRNAGACFLHAKYGPPSRAMHDWLAAGGWEQARRAPGLGPPALPFVSAEYRVRSSGVLVSQVWFFGMDPVACLSGRLRACEAAAEPRPWQNERAAWRHLPTDVLSLERFRLVRHGEYALLATLEANLGPAAFARLWTAPDPFPVAVAGLAGQPLGEVMRAALLAQFEPVTAGAWPSAAEWVVALVLLATLLVLAARGVTSRTV